MFDWLAAMPCDTVFGISFSIGVKEFLCVGCHLCTAFPAADAFLVHKCSAEFWRLTC